MCEVYRRETKQKKAAIRSSTSKVECALEKDLKGIKHRVLVDD